VRADACKPQPQAQAQAQVQVQAQAQEQAQAQARPPLQTACATQLALVPQRWLTKRKTLPTNVESMEKASSAPGSSPAGACSPPAPALCTWRTAIM
jgi:hypothetical protein